MSDDTTAKLVENLVTESPDEALEETAAVEEATGNTDRAGRVLNAAGLPVEAGNDTEAKRAYHAATTLHRAVGFLGYGLFPGQAAQELFEIRSYLEQVAALAERQYEERIRELNGNRETKREAKREQKRAKKARKTDN